jgi:hypothetical protein
MSPPEESPQALRRRRVRPSPATAARWRSHDTVRQRRIAGDMANGTASAFRYPKSTGRGTRELRVGAHSRRSFVADRF